LHSSQSTNLAKANSLRFIRLFGHGSLQSDAATRIRRHDVSGLEISVSNDAIVVKASSSMVCSEPTDVSANIHEVMPSAATNSTPRNESNEHASAVPKQNPLSPPWVTSGKARVATRTIAASPMVHSVQARCVKCTKRVQGQAYGRNNVGPLREILIDRRTSAAIDGTIAD
jgi:hypothetical protein